MSLIDKLMNREKPEDVNNKEVVLPFGEGVKEAEADVVEQEIASKEIQTNATGLDAREHSGAVDMPGEGKKSPIITITFPHNGRPNVEIKNYNGLNGRRLQQIESMINKKLHQLRVAEIQAKDTKQRAGETAN